MGTLYVATIMSINEPMGIAAQGMSGTREVAVGNAIGLLDDLRYANVLEEKHLLENWLALHVHVYSVSKDVFVINGTHVEGSV